MIYKERKSSTPFIVWLGLIACSLVSVGISVSGNVIAGLMLFGVMAGIFLLSQPTLMLWIIAFVVLIANGAAQFFLNISQLQWVSSLLGGALILSTLIHKVMNYSAVTSQRFKLIPLDFLFLGYVLVLIISTIINFIPIPQLIVGLRTYIPFLGVYLVVRSGLISKLQLKRLFKFLLWVAFLQVPVVLYQSIVVVKQRIASNYFGSAWDSVVGTFGGTMFGGGASGSLAIYAVCILLLGVANYRFKVFSKLYFFIIFLTVSVIFGLSETKVIFVLIPLGFFVLYRDLIIKRPFAFILGCVSMAAFLMVIFFAYFKLYYSDDASGDFEQQFESRFGSSFDPTFMATRDVPGRFTALFIWSNNHSMWSDPLRLMLGHGIAAATSQSTLMAPSKESKRYGLGLDVSGAAKLLWEAGLIGFLIYASIFMIAIMLCMRMNRHIKDKAERATLNFASASLLVLIAGVPYELTTVGSPPLQFFSMFLLGYVGYSYESYKNQNVL